MDVKVKPLPDYDAGSSTKYEIHSAVIGRVELCVVVPIGTSTDVTRPMLESIASGSRPPKFSEM